MRRIVQNNFVSGVISPSLWGRSDLAAYYRGVADAENYVVTKTGTLRKRHGMYSVSLPLGWIPLNAFPYRYDRTEGGVVLVAWVPDKDGSNVGHVRVGVFDKSGARVEEDGPVNLKTESFKDTDDLSFARDVRCVQIGDTLYLTGGGVFFMVVVTVDGGSMSGATVKRKSFAPTGKPDRVSSFSCTGISPDGDPYQNPHARVDYMAAIVVNGVMSEWAKGWATQKRSWEAGAYTAISVTVSSAQRSAGFDYVVVGKSVGGTYGELTRFYPEDFDSAGSNSQSYRDYNVSPGAGIYRQSDVLGMGSSFHPMCVCAFQQRLVLANAGLSPMTLWFSEIGNLYNFWADRPVNDDDPFSPTIVSGGPAFIRWLCAFQDSLLCFTDCGIFDIRSDSTQNGFGSTTCKISLCSDVACSQKVAPIPTTAGVVFVGSDDKTLYTVSYDLQSDSKRPTDRMVLSSHLTRSSRIVSMSLQSYPDSVVWCVLEDGSVLSFTHQPEQEVYAWSRHSFSGLKAKFVVGLGTVTDSDSDYTRGDVAFVALKDDGEYVLAFPGNGWSDVVDGVSTPVRASFTTLSPESQDRTIAGVAKNVKDVLIRIHESGELSVRPAAGGLPAQRIRLPAGAGTASGAYKVMPRGYVNEDGRMTFESSDAKPSEVLAVVFDMEVSQ